MGIQHDVLDNPIPVGTRNPKHRDACNSQPRSGKSSRRIGQPARTSWPIWYLVTIFGLHCIGNYPKKYERPTLLDLGQYNFSSHTHHEAFQSCKNYQIDDSTTHALDPPHKQTKAVSDLWCRHCIGATVAIFGDCNPQIPFTCPDAIPCHNSGKGKDFDIDGRNSTVGNYEGISQIRTQGLPKHPYGAHLTGGCIGAAHLPAGVHCKSPRNGSPKPPFGLSSSLVSRLLSIGDLFCNLGYSGLHYNEWLWQSSCASISADNRPVDTLDMMYAHTVACSCTNQHAIIDTEADSCLEASSTCDFHLDAFQTLNPPVQGSSNSICDPHLFIGGSCLQSQTLSNGACP